MDADKLKALESRVARLAAGRTRRTHLSGLLKAKADNYYCDAARIRAAKRGIRWYKRAGKTGNAPGHIREKLMLAQQLTKSMKAAQ